MTSLKTIAACGALAVIALAGCSSNNMRHDNAAASSSTGSQPSSGYSSYSCQTPDWNVGCNSPGNY